MTDQEKMVQIRELAQEMDGMLRYTEAEQSAIFFNLGIFFTKLERLTRLDATDKAGRVA